MDKPVRDKAVETMKHGALDKMPHPLTVSSRMRKYGPPSDWIGPQPGPDREIYCGNLPKDFFEDELIPLFEKCGQIWDLRLMMDPHANQSRGFCFITFVDECAVKQAVDELNGYVIDGKNRLKVSSLTSNRRLIIKGVPTSRRKEEIMLELINTTGGQGLMDVIVCTVPGDPRKRNRGFAFLDYICHRSASVAKQRIESGLVKVFNCDITVDWADPLEPPDEEAMSKVKVLFIRNLKADVSEDQLRERFEWYGRLERVKKLEDCGFIHFMDRENALKALEELHGTKINGFEMLISLAKPPVCAMNAEKRDVHRAMMPGRQDPLSGMYSGRFGLAPSCRVPSSLHARMLEPAKASHATLGVSAAYDSCAGEFNQCYDGYSEFDYGQGATYSFPVVPAVPRTKGHRGDGLLGMTKDHGHKTLSLRPSLGIPDMAVAGMGTLVIGPMCDPFEHGMENAGSEDAMASLKRKATQLSQAETKKPHTQDASNTEPIVHQLITQMATCSVADVGAASPLSGHE